MVEPRTPQQEAWLQSRAPAPAATGGGLAVTFQAGTFTDVSQIVKEFFLNDSGWDAVFERMDAVQADLLKKAAKCTVEQHAQRLGMLEGFEYAIGVLRALKTQMSERKDTDG